jgi:hypothetical protein
MSNRNKFRRWVGLATSLTLITVLAAAVPTTAQRAPTDQDLRQAQQELSPSPPPTEPAMPVLEGTWKQLADPPFGSNFGAGAWTGEEVLVTDVPSGRVAAYDTETDTWSELSAGPEDIGPDGLGVLSPTVWTGRELLLFDNTLFDRTHGSDKAYAFDPTTSTWRELAPMPFVPSFAVWADGLAVIADPQRHVAAYDPEFDAWTELPRAPGAKELRGLFWSGTEVLAVTAPKKRSVTTIAALDPTTDAWAAPVEGPLSSVIADEGLWAGDRLLFASGGPSTRTIPGVVLDATFDPATNAWTVVDYDCVGSATGLWTGGLAISPLGRHALDPTTGQCLALPGSKVVKTYAERRAWDTKVWTGRELVLWSGEEGGEGGRPELVAISFTTDGYGKGISST